MPRLTRRHFLGCSAAAITCPARAQSMTWDEVSRKAASLEQCHGMIVRQAGADVVKEIYRGPGMERAVPIKSVSKTFVAALTGAALDRGELPSVNATLGELTPGLIPKGADPRVAAITVEDLVTMQAGLERTSGGNYGNWVASSNWVANALSRPMIREPGNGMLYSTGTTHVLGAILAEVTGKSLLTQARERLGRPLGIDIPAWTRDPQGRYLGGNEMSLTLPAMIRFGQMYCNGGRYEGQQVLSRDWVQQSFEPVTRSVFSRLEYGYGWFLSQAGGVDYALARGYGGQIICVAPALQLTVAITSDPTRAARSGGYFGDLLRLIDEWIIPAAQAEAA